MPHHSNSSDRWWISALFSGVMLAFAGGSFVEEASAQWSRNLDAAALPRGGSARIDMMPGRLNKVPVSWFRSFEVSLPGGHTHRFRTTGCDGDADTGIVVTWTANRIPYTAFDNDGNTGTDDRSNGRCSLINTGHHASLVTYTIYVFSMTRATSFASLQFLSSDQMPGNEAWVTVEGSAQNYGGTLVRVGPLQKGDFLEVQTASDGACDVVCDDTTQMLLFEPSAGALAKAPIRSVNAGTFDRDPRIMVEDDSWSSPLNAVLIGKVDRNNSSLKGVETRVDLLRGPLEVNAGAATLSCSGPNCTGDSVVLPRGRYYASAHAKTPNPLGSVTNIQNASDWHFATEVGSDDVGKCSYEHVPAQPARYPRGHGNDHAFTVVIRKDGEDLRPPIKRVIPRGLLGEDGALGSFNRIVMEIEADGLSSFSLNVTNKADDVTLFDKWEFARNPDVNEIKIATWNFAHWAPEDQPGSRSAIVKNGVDLLGTRGDLDPQNQRVIERADQAPWQWEADVIAFQEFWHDTHEGVAARLQERTAFGWAWVNGWTERNTGFGAARRMFGPVFVNSFFWPSFTQPNGVVRRSIKYADSQLDDGQSPNRCNSRADSSYDFVCHILSVDSYFGRPYPGALHRYAVPAKLSAIRKIGNSANAGADRPIAFFNWHLFYPDEAFVERQEQVSNFIKSAKYLMAQPGYGAVPAGACAFNRECINDPKHFSNRMIIVGDTNARNHECGEFAWLLSSLRAEFGYAIDISAATVDVNHRTFDMHWSGAPIEQMRWTTCQDKDGNESKTLNADGTSAGCPFKFENRHHWHKTPDMTVDSWFPWWAATYQHQVDGLKNHGGQRYDVVFLVGRGWAYDDPVRSYKVMPHYDQASPMNDMTGGGIQLNYDYECKGMIRKGRGGQTMSYAPKESVCSYEGCTQCRNDPGAPAIASDHIPVGARLRVWAR